MTGLKDTVARLDTKEREMKFIKRLFIGILCFPAGLLGELIEFAKEDPIKFFLFIICMMFIALMGLLGFVAIMQAGGHWQ